jgi:ABC-type multidrug transport system fused ATPase/permease subunit
LSHNSIVTAAAVSTFLINTVVQGTLLLIGTIMIQHGKLTGEVLLAFMLYQGQLQNETQNLFNSYTSLIKSSGAGDKVFALLDRRPRPPSVGDSRSVSDESPPEESEEQEQRSHNYDVQLKGVTFQYPSRPEATVLDALDLNIPKGKTVALVGESGCGKSTIINLLQRFYDPSAGGGVLIDGVNLKLLDLLSHRRHIGVVTQDPVLFCGTLRENIAFGCPLPTPGEATTDDNEGDIVERAARLANADSFIRQFPDGYETEIGERGVQLSGGQKQRIAIARAVIRNPSLLLLDEATSALDAESEEVVQEALDRLLKQNREMTTVIVAHRLRTVRNADKIAVLHGGRVVEEGTHEQLMKMAGVYHKMVSRASSTGMLPES